MELTDLELNDNDFSRSSNGFSKSSNFGGGLELLMNDKIKETNKLSSDIDLEDLNNLENELNDLVDDAPNSYKPKSDFFNKPSVSFEDSNIKSSLSQLKVWSGYSLSFKLLNSIHASE